MSQYGQGNPFIQPNAGNGGYGGYAQPMYNMGYGQSMMASQYGTAYPPAFPNAANVPQGEVSRTIYLGNVNPDISAHDILKCVRTGHVESYRHCAEKSCAFLSFVDPASAQAFYNEHLVKKLVVGDTEIKIGWGKSGGLSNVLKSQIQSGATRTVYIGRIAETDTEESIKATCVAYGPIENVKILREKNLAFVYFLSIAAATTCIAALKKDPEWVVKKINYGKDSCAPQYQQANAHDMYPLGNQMNLNMYGQLPTEMFSGYAMNDIQTAVAPVGSVLRTLYIGNIHPQAKVEDICNTIRGGNLLQIRFLSDKNIAFVTFFDAATALNVFNHAQTAGLVVRGRRLRVGWGKPSSISVAVSQSIQQGATRNIYIGGIPEDLTEEKLRADFAEYGEIELVNTFREKKCAFVNFTNINNAITAIAAMRLKPDYADYKLNFGKDRCGNDFKVNTKKNIVKEEPKPEVQEKPFEGRREDYVDIKF